MADSVRLHPITGEESKDTILTENTRNRQEFYVRFKGPEESRCCVMFLATPGLTERSAFRWWTLENPRRTP